MLVGSMSPCCFAKIKQHLGTKAFYGNRENAVNTQIWIAVTVDIQVAIVRKRLGIATSLYQLLEIFSGTLLKKAPVLQVLQRFESQNEF